MASSIRSLAREVGASPSTVSRALRNVGRISPELRRRIRQAAERAGYKAHPILSRALTLARLPSPERYRETLAVLVEFRTEEGADYQKAYMVGIEERASLLAFKIETFVLSGRPLHHRQLSRILWNRGIRGLIILPRVRTQNPRLQMDWARFASVEVGRLLWSPRNLDRIESPQYPKTLEIIHLLKKVGYRRIGMAVEPQHNQRLNGVYYAAYLLMQQKFPSALRIPIPGLTVPWSETGFCKWFLRYKPEVLIVHDVVDICAWLQKLNLRIPKDISIFRLGIREDDPPGPHKNHNWTGIRGDQKEQGRRAVDLVSNLLDRGELGLKGNPMSWLVDGHWRPGKTLTRAIDQFISDEGFLRESLKPLLATQKT